MFVEYFNNITKEKSVDAWEDTLNLKFGGIVFQTLHLEPQKQLSFVRAITLGGYDGLMDQVVELFSGDEAGLDEPADVDLVNFNRRLSFEELLDWNNMMRDRYQFMLPKHLYAIAMQYRNEKFPAPILCLGSVRNGHVLFLNNHFGWRFLSPSKISGDWDKSCLFGFIRKPT